MAEKTIEDRLNNFYVKAWAIIEDLTQIDIPQDDPIRKSVDTFVSAIQDSFETILREGYVSAWADLEKASAGFIGLCRYKDIVHQLSSSAFHRNK